jgi:malonyl CoA-acyl carrier protein transacylase
MTTALLFPGQGSHADGMEQPWRDSSVIARGIEILGEDPFTRLAEGTRWQQPALFLCGLAALEAEDGLEPAAAAGHSLGEYAALVAADALAFEDALGLVALRADAMARAGEAAPGGMVAFLGGDATEVSALAARHRLSIANDNAPGQLVLSGPLAAVEAVEAEAAELRLRARRLDVSGAFHSELMAPAAEELREALRGVDVREPWFPVWSNGSAAPFRDVRRELAENLLSTVRWRETLLALRAKGIERFVTLGPDKVLNGLVKRTLAEAA